MPGKSFKNSPRYKWVILVLCFLMIFVGLGFCSSNKSLYLQPVTDFLGIGRTAFSVGDSIRFIVTAVVNIFFGALVKKFGTKKLMLAGLVSLAAAVLLYSVADRIVWFYIGGAFLGIGFSWTSTTMVGCVVNQWCREKKGTVMGAVLASNGIGTALSTQILSPMIYKTASGYRNAYRLTALFVLIVAVLVLLFFKEKTGQDGEAPTPSKKSKTGEWSGITVSQALRKPYFYITMVCLFITGMILQGVNGVSAAHLRDVGISPEFIALTLSIYSLAVSASKLITGVMRDKCGVRITALCCDIASVISMFALAFVSQSSAGMVLAMIFGITAAISIPLETIMLPIFSLDLFGVRDYEHFLGVAVSVNTAGYAVGGVLMNAAYEMTGSYQSILIIFGLIMIVVTVLFQFLIQAANKQKTLHTER